MPSHLFASSIKEIQEQQKNRLNIDLLRGNDSEYREKYEKSLADELALVINSSAGKRVTELYDQVVSTLKTVAEQTIGFARKSSFNNNFNSSKRFLSDKVLQELSAQQQLLRGQLYNPGDGTNNAEPLTSERRQELRKLRAEVFKKI